MLVRSAPMMQQARRSLMPKTFRRCSQASRHAAGPTINGMTCPGLHLTLGFRKEGGTDMIRNMPRDAAVYGVDLGKNLFHVVGLDTSGAVIQRLKFRRDTLLTFFERAARAVVGMEACPGSQWLARKLQVMGH